MFFQQIICQIVMETRFFSCRPHRVRWAAAAGLLRGTPCAVQAESHNARATYYHQPVARNHAASHAFAWRKRLHHPKSCLTTNVAHSSFIPSCSGIRQVSQMPVQCKVRSSRYRGRQQHIWRNFLSLPRLPPFENSSSA